MNFRHLSVFLAVSEELNMTRAARKLFMTQPSVSQMVAELENYYNTRLFERLNHRLFLTDAGRRLQSYARHIINLEAQAKKELADLSQAGVLRVGASQTVGAYFMPEVIRRFHERFPLVELFTCVENTREIELLLLADRLDLGLVEGRVHSPDLIEEPVVDDELCIACPPGHPLANMQALSIQDLAGQNFILREEGSGTREIFANQMQTAGTAWKEAGTYNSTEAIKSAVKNGLGMAVLPLIAITGELSQGMLVALHVKGLSLSRKFNLVYHRQKYFSPVMHSFRAGLIGKNGGQ